MKLLISLTITCVCVTAFPANSESYSASWATRSGGSMSDDGFGVVTLTDGSIMTTGFFRGTAIFGEGEPNETTLTSAGISNAFLAKYDSDGNLVWAISEGGLGDDIGVAIGKYSDDGVVISGNFTGTVTFGNGQPNETTLNAAGGSDIFIAKYDSDGALEWVKRAGGSSFHEARDVNSMSDGGAVLAGYFRGISTFGEGEINETVLTGGTGQNGFFVARFNADGSLAWAKQAVGSGSSAGIGVCGLPDGTVFATGEFGASATFGLGEPNETSFAGPGPDQFVLTKYNSNGTLAWATRGVGTGFDIGNDIVALSDGTTIVTGHIGYTSGGTTTFGSGEINETVVSSPSTMRGFVGRFDPNGLVEWVRTFDSDTESSGRGVVALSDGSVVLTGTVSGVTVFGVGQNETTIASAGGRDIFLAMYDSNGALLLASGAGGSLDDYGDGIALNSDGDLLVSGRFRSDAAFGSETLTSAGLEDVFLAKFLLSSGTLTLPTLTVTGIVIAMGLLCIAAFQTVRKTDKKLISTSDSLPSAKSR